MRERALGRAIALLFTLHCTPNDHRPLCNMKTLSRMSKNGQNEHFEYPRLVKVPHSASHKFSSYSKIIFYFNRNKSKFSDVFRTKLIFKVKHKKKNNNNNDNNNENTAYLLHRSWTSGTPCHAIFKIHITIRWERYGMMCTMEKYVNRYRYNSNWRCSSLSHFHAAQANFIWK